MTELRVIEMAQCEQYLQNLLGTANLPTNHAIRENLKRCSGALESVRAEINADADLVAWVRDQDDEKHPEAKEKMKEFNNCKVQIDPYRVNADKLPADGLRIAIRDEKGKITGYETSQELAAAFDFVMDRIGAL